MIKIMTKDGCNECNELKKYLDSKGIDYKVVNLSKKENREERKHYRTSGYKLLPVVEGDGWSIDGYNKELLEGIL